MAPGRNVYIPLLPNASVDLEMTAIAYNDWDEGTARLGRPVVAAFGGKEIKRAHDGSLTLEDFNLGGKFTKDSGLESERFSTFPKFFEVFKLFRTSKQTTKHSNLSITSGGLLCSVPVIP